MKKLLSIGLMLTSLSAFSQSYLVLSNGVTLTTDKYGHIYDFGNFVIPYKVSGNGGQFIVENQKLSTVDSNGFLYEKDLKIKNIRGSGLNYFVGKDNVLYTIDENGFHYKFDKEKKTFKKISDFGGKFFIVKENEKKGVIHLYTLNSKGNYFQMDVAGLNPLDIEVLGGNYFQTKQGELYTISNDGFVFLKTDLIVGKIIKVGGNFFVDSNNKLFTVGEDGILNLPILPYNMKVDKIFQTGANYMIDTEGRIFTASHQGELFEREVEHDLLNSKIFSF